MRSIVFGIYMVPALFLSEYSMGNHMLDCDLSLAQLSITYTTCYGANDGSIVVDIMGGTTPYYYIWNNGDSTQSIVVNAGIYNVTVTDAEGCEFILEGLEVQDPDEINIDILNLIPASCEGIPDGGFEWWVEGGFAPYKYYIDGQQRTGNSATLVAGNYQFIVEDATGCTMELMVNIPAIIEIEINFEEVHPAISCLGSTGSATISVQGGMMPYEIVWSNGTVGEEGVDLANGWNSVIVVDASGCRVIDSVFIELFDLSLEVDSIEIHPISCAGGSDGSIQIYIGEGAPPFMIDWQHGATSPLIEELSPGRYYVTITDANGCKIAIENIMLEEPEPVSYTLIDVIHPSCHDSADGQILLELSGGTGPVNAYLDGIAVVTDSLFLPEGFYEFHFVDSLTCEILERFQLESPPPLELIVENLVHPDCGIQNGEIALVTIGGAGMLNYTWEDGSSGSSLTGLSYGNYLVTVEDENGCTSQGNYYLEGGDDLLLEFEAISVSCPDMEDGSIAIRILNPVGDFYILWINGIMQDESFNINEPITGLKKGSYSIQLESETGCHGSIEAEILVQEEIQIYLDEYFTIPIGSSIHLEPEIYASNTSGLIYNWDPDQYLSCSDCIYPIANPTSTTTYTLKVTRPNGCAYEVQTTIHVESDDLIYFPTVFSPNNDGTNDRYRVFSSAQVSNIHYLRIYDRWGNLIFEARDCSLDNDFSNCHWDGKLKGQDLMSQVYVAVIQVETSNGEVMVLSSDFLLIR